MCKCNTCVCAGGVGVTCTFFKTLGRGAKNENNRDNAARADTVKAFADAAFSDQRKLVWPQPTEDARIFRFQKGDISANI